MCLKATRNEPYNHSRTAYKILMMCTTGCGVHKGHYVSPYKGNKWTNKELTADYSRRVMPYSGDPEREVNYGIHVFPTLKEAVYCYKNTTGNWNHESVTLCKVKVRGFIAAGTHTNYSEWGDGKRGECWAHAKIVKVLRRKNSAPGFYC